MLCMVDPVKPSLESTVDDALLNPSLSRFKFSICSKTCEFGTRTGTHGERSYALPGHRTKFLECAEEEEGLPNSSM